MADTLCGPSNPLQSFQKHTSIDRTLQQDRLTSRYSPSQGFRSGPGPSAGLLDPEFEAFQAGHPTGHFDPGFNHRPTQHFSPAPTPAFAHPLEPLGWASDFQRLHISQSQSNLAPIEPQFRHHNRAGWHHDFQAHQQTPPVPMSTESQYQPRFDAMPLYNFQPQYYPEFIMPRAEQSAQTRWKGKRKISNLTELDSVAFEQAFDAYAHSEARQGAGESITRYTELGQDVIVDEDKDASIRDFEPFEVLHGVTMEEQYQPQDMLQDQRLQTDDDLAQTAEEVLLTVSDNNSQKFQDSTFLALMRRLRDREVRVAGDKMVEVEEVEISKSIPPDEQDVDQGRDVRMAGALRPNQVTDEVPERRRKSRTLAGNLFIPDWDSYGDSYGGHMVDDF